MEHRYWAVLVSQDLDMVPKELHFLFLTGKCLLDPGQLSTEVEKVLTSSKFV